MFAVWTGRFQPPHEGHFKILRHSIEALGLPHATVLTAYFGWKSRGDYAMFADEAYDAKRNPLTIWERVWLMRLGLAGHCLSENVTVLTAPRHDLDWPRVAEFYPPHRVICLTAKDDFERAKARLWEQRGERVHVFNELDGTDTLTTTKIKAMVAAGEDWRRFIPEACHAFFEEIDGPSRVFR